MSTTLDQAHKQWALRPHDQRFKDLESMYRFVNQRKKSSMERSLKLNRMHLFASEEGSLLINGNGPEAHLSNWSFWQLCSSVDAPARYLRRLPADLVQQCLGTGLRKSNRSCKLLTRSLPNSGESNGTLQAAAITGLTYGRIWDADVLAEVGKAVKGTKWHIPFTNNEDDERPTGGGLYASDRDMFIFLVNEESPIMVGEARLKQGFFCWNSETGSSSFGLMTFLYNTICDNHIVWDAENVREFRFPHRQNAQEYFRNEAVPMLQNFVNRDSETGYIRQIVDKAMNLKIADNFDDLLKWGEDKPFSDHELQKAWVVGEANGEKADTVWGLIQGLTDYAQNIGYMNKRVYLERRAGSLLSQLDEL